VRLLRRRRGSLGILLRVRWKQLPRVRNVRGELRSEDTEPSRIVGSPNTRRADGNRDALAEFAAGH